MKILETYSNAVKDSTAILEAVLPDQSSGIINDAKKIVREMNSECAVRVPFVGDFNAGKSTLLNTMLGTDLLPTNITPETAVSYELIYSSNEHLEVFKDGKSVGEYPLTEIKSLHIQPGDTVKVFLNKVLLRECQEKRLMLVDMPGIDSGIQAHNAAIVKYLRPGTRYMVFSDSEQGTIRSTALSFIKELGKYEDIDFSIFLSKCDKKTPEEIEKVKSAASLAVSTIYPDHSVGVTSSFNKDYDDVLAALNRIDAESILGRKYKVEVSSILDQMLQSLQRNIQLLAGNIKDADKAIAEISDKKNEALANLAKRSESAQPLSGSADDIVRDIKEAIVKNSASLAAMLLNKADTEQINSAMLQIIRPVLINSFKRELSEYQEVISSALVSFSVDVDKILSDSDNSLLAGAQDIVGNMVGKDIVEAILVKGLEKAAAKFAGYKGIGALLNGLSKILGPLATIIVNIVPDLLRLIFGKSKEKKLTEIQLKITSEVADRISEGMRSEIESILEEQRRSADKQMSDAIEKEAAQVDASIRESVKAKSQEKEMLQQKIKELTKALEQISAIKSSL